MLDLVVANEGEPDVVQISGGEPTLYPQFWELDWNFKKRLHSVMQRVAKHLARFIAYLLITAPREMLRCALHDEREILTSFAE